MEELLEYMGDGFSSVPWSTIGSRYLVLYSTSVPSSSYSS